MKKHLFNDSWYFARTPLAGKITNINTWYPVAIPHDWLIYDTKNLYESGIGWYKKSFVINSLADTDYIALRFDGVYEDTVIFINGVQAFTWKNGYTTFEFDATPFLTAGTNELIVKVTYQSPNSRWYSGAGIYRNVWFVKGHVTHFVSDGIYITPTKRDNETWDVLIDAELSGALSSEYKIQHEIIDGFGQVVVQAEKKSSGSLTDTQVLSVSHPLLWDVGKGNLYVVRSSLVARGEVLDVAECRFGFREIQMSPTGGFVINGRRMKLFGVCQHHDLGALGAAFNPVAAKRQLELLQKMGMNAIRTAHNVFAPEFMALCDAMGILVCSEIFDMWKNPKTTYDYARFFDEWAGRDVAAWIRRDRNCPSVIMWSIGNEVSDTHVDGSGLETMQLLMGYVAQHDPLAHAPATFGSNYLPWENTQKCGDVIKLVGYNYAEKYYAQHHEKYPDWIIYGSETASTVQSRGIYKFPLSQSLMADDDEQCSALGNSSTSWGARSPEACLIADRDAPFSLGQFIWTGTDYIGEPTPYHTKNSYLGQLDTAGFFKDSAYIYQSAWTDYKTHPMVHIFPYWDFTPSQLIDVRVVSNAPKVELFFNDASLGSFEIDHIHGEKLVADWQIPYHPGVLKAVAYDEQGSVIATDMTRSFSDGAALTMTADKLALKADGEDLIFVEIGVVDAFGVPVANANNRVTVEVRGAGRLIGLDNGDSTDDDSYKGTARRLFSGKLLAIICGNHEPGEIEVTVTSVGLTPCSNRFTAVKADVPVGSSTTFIANTPSVRDDAVPIRKIELLCVDGSNRLNRDCRSAVVTAKVLPTNATFRDLSWRVTNQAGIDSTLATLDILADGSVCVTALGDGVFYLRCMAGNGSDKPRLISQLDFTVTGVGDAFLNPYGFISGGLYTDSNIELTNGNDRGVATDRELVSHVIFEGVDFGPIGSDTITLPLFPLLENVFPIEIWEGKPYSDQATQVATVYYDLGKVWNTYQEKTYQLPRKFTGLTTVAFVFKQKVHIKGFSFAAPVKVLEQISATDYDFLSGDSFNVTDEGVEGIGNNVTLRFDEMDFSVQTVRQISICGKTPLDVNPIQMRFTGDTEESIQVVGFTKSDTYTVQTFDLEQITVNGHVSFVFLPGCQFDFKWFKFS